MWDRVIGEELVRLITGAAVHTICASTLEPGSGVFLAFGGAAGVAAVDVNPLLKPAPWVG